MSHPMPWFAAVVAGAVLSAQGPVQTADGKAEHVPLDARVAGLSNLPIAAREAAVRRIADDALHCVDDAERQRAGEALRALPMDVYYSPSADAPAWLWYEYVRALRRLDVRDGGDDAAGLRHTLDSFGARRRGLRGAFGANPPSAYDLTSYGWHGAQELLAAVAELVEPMGAQGAELGSELARYLAFEALRPVAPRCEGNAGIGEDAPAGDAGRAFPVRWIDDYRFALARAVLATRPKDADLATANLHLLYSPRRDDRLAAIARLREAPLSADAVLHLLAQLDDADRLLRREVISTLGSGGAEARAARERLRQFAAGDDKELRALAGRALQLLGVH